MQHRILICVRGVCSEPRLGQQLEQKLNALIAQHGLDDPEHPQHASCRLTNCLAVCEDGPIIIVHPEAIKYRRVDAAALERIFQQHLLHNEPVAELQVKALPPRPIKPSHSSKNPFRRNSKQRD